ncbi:MAG TPA: hypothetical protein VMV92_05490 [Streptosporangiaceae bacterium]|nr:hypothetical protein [Streptosporangiaceae bacterium]
METQVVQEAPQSAPGGETPALPVPEGHPAEQWASRAERALEARALGLRLRKGKRLVFSSRHHLAR